MSSILVHVCHACDATGETEDDDPTAIPSFWGLFDDGTRLLCERCAALRRQGRPDANVPSDKLGIVVGKPTQVAHRRCPGCHELSPTEDRFWRTLGDREVCIGCVRQAEDDGRARAWAETP